MPSQELSLFAREQFRICRLQVFNWGTFAGLHDVPMSERGFLFVGGSGSGKTTLLDAFSALLIPPRWLEFNAAAREGGVRSRDRNALSYVRGAWAEQKDGDSGEYLVRYLRPGTTWSALAATYRSSHNHFVTLVQLFWIRGSSNANTDVRRYYLIFDRSFELKDLQGRFELDIRKLKQAFPDAFARDEFSAYCERFCRLLGIEKENALRLLHKTQSAKNLGDLNTFLRDFMLDKPETFDAADRLVNEFAELNAAHQEVVKAREQVQTLAPARDEHQRYQQLRQEVLERDDLRRGLNAYRERMRMTLYEERLAELQIKLTGQTGEVARRKAALDNCLVTVRDLEEQLREAGGGRIEQLESEMSGLQERRDERLRRRRDAQTACAKLDWALPDSPQAFAELTGRARQALEDGQRQMENSQNVRDGLVLEKDTVDKKFKDTARQVDELQRQPSNIESNMLELRRWIAEGIGVPEAALPFAGELIQVRAKEAEWQGAIERVLHGFALSLLVEERYYARISEYVNNTQLGERLVYYRTARPEFAQDRRPLVNSLVRKMEFKDSVHTAWLEAELVQRFDYACVDSVAAMRREERALTREGQVKHSKTRHEKDDRHAIDNRRKWVLGFDNREKLALLKQDAHALAEESERLRRELDALSERQRKAMESNRHYVALANAKWEDIDAAPFVDRIAAIERQLKELRQANTTLQEIDRRLEQQKQLLQGAQNKLNEAAARELKINEDIHDATAQLNRLRQREALYVLSQTQQDGLEARFGIAQTITIDTLDALSREVDGSLETEIRQRNTESNRLEKAVESRFAEFKRRWQAESADLEATLDSALEFLALLQRLELDGLPAHENRFFELLRTQSHQNLAALSKHLDQARKDIYMRLEDVNESLGKAEFGRGTFLHIHPSDRQLQEVRDFRQEISRALEHAWDDNREQAEQRFLILRGLVTRFASQESADRMWREMVLDVRQHVEFIAREMDAEGNEVEAYRSGAGKSGGQRQKLATTCLAAALRYQLGGENEGAPVYAPVILDEAFDKADNEFTELAMRIFEQFNFQMIVATPLKSVMTLEQFIGGACFVDIRERKDSRVLLIEYDEQRQRLNLPEHKVKDADASVS